MLGERKTALFVIISDTDSTFNFLVSIMYSHSICFAIRQMMYMAAGCLSTSAAYWTNLLTSVRFRSLKN